jgi:hypothetical protein
MFPTTRQGGSLADVVQRSSDCGKSFVNYVRVGWQARQGSRDLKDYQCDSMAPEESSLAGPPRMVPFSALRREVSRVRYRVRLREIAARHPEVDLVYPLHMNPDVRKPVFDILGHGLKTTDRCANIYHKIGRLCLPAVGAQIIC